MILIADGGSTKTSWYLVNKAREQVAFETEGYNPFFVDSSYIQRSLAANLPVLQQEKITDVYFYGAGCSGDKCDIVKNGLQRVFTRAKINVHIDLLASARALLGVNAGFAAILGTGTNSCLYNGQKITHHIDSLGYLLGDEGSGWAIGKQLLIDYIRGYMPARALEDFRQQYQLTPDEMMDKLYGQQLVSRFCAGFSRFITIDKVQDEYYYNLVRNCFKDFFVNLVSQYPQYDAFTFNCIGSVGYNFKNILTEVSLEFGMSVGRILRSPIEDLVKYHLEARVGDFG